MERKGVCRRVARERESNSRFWLVIVREKQREELGGGAIADGETRAKNASGNGP
jgi:hypothetical protein